MEWSKKDLAIRCTVWKNNDLSAQLTHLPLKNMPYLEMKRKVTLGFSNEKPSKMRKTDENIWFKSLTTVLRRCM